MQPVIKPITGRQKEVLNFINSFLNEKGFAPSLRELAEFLNTENLSTAQYFVKELVDKGYLKREHHKSRGIMPISQKQSVPLLGYIAAGQPIEPIENPEPIEVPRHIKLNSGQSYYALRIKGDSMIDMGIIDNDVAIIKHQLVAQNNDVVVAITENGATLKVYKEKNGLISLEARNDNYQTIYPNELEIRGKFVGLIRAE